jgi:hypothetical protein
MHLERKGLIPFMIDSVTVHAVIIDWNNGCCNGLKSSIIKCSPRSGNRQTSTERSEMASHP